MFYKCNKCKEVWQYPIKKCPNCFSFLEKMPSKKVKVVGASLVKISTIMHPKVPYSVFILEDENGNKWAHKSIKEHKIGEIIEFEKTEDKDAVAIWRVKYDFFEAIDAVFNLLCQKIKLDSKILLLPTLVAPKHSYFARNTSPEVLEAIIEYLIKNGVDRRNIKVAAQSFDDIPIEILAKKSGLLDVCLKNKITPFNLEESGFVKKAEGKFTFDISKEILDNDFIINIANLEVGSDMKTRGAVENIKRLIKKESYFSLKYLYSEDELIEKLIKILPKFLTVADGFFISRSDNFVKFLGVIMASFNPSNLDKIFEKIIMNRNLKKDQKEVKIDDISIVGRKIDEIMCNLEKI